MLATAHFEQFLLDLEVFWSLYRDDEIDPVCQGLISVMEKLLAL